MGNTIRNDTIANAQSINDSTKNPPPPRTCFGKLRRIPSKIASMVCGLFREPDDDLSDDVRVGYHCVDIFCNGKFRKLLLALLIVSAIFSALAVAFYSAYGVILWKNSNILCIGWLRFASILLGFISVPFVVGGIYFLGLHYPKTKEKSRERAKRIIFIVFFIAFLSHLVPGVVMHTISTHMLVRDPNTKNYYHCEAENSPMVAYPILFSLDSCNSSQLNQICQFRSVTNLCEADLRSFGSFSQLIWVNGTHGACHCKSPSSEGLQVCRNYFHEFENYPSLGILFSCLATATYILTYVGICLQDKPDAYDWLIGCCVRCGCTCCETLRPLISEKPHTHESTLNI